MAHRSPAAVLRRFRDQARGAIAVEAALVLPVLVMLLVGAVDFGMAFVESLRLSAAARAGTQQALYDPRGWQDATLMELTALSEYTGTAVTSADRSALSATARSRAFCGCADGTELLCTSTCAGGATPAQYVEVTVTDDVTFTIDWPFIDGRTLQLARDSIVRVR